MRDNAILYVTPFRRLARRREREIQQLLDDRGLTQSEGAANELLDKGVPPWAKGVKVVKAGRFSWAVVATEARGH